MKALILCSGAGERLRPLTRNKPKPLIAVGGNTILGYQLDNLIACGINNVIITTGPFEHMIKKYVANKYPTLAVSYVKNHRYRVTNYIYSMWLTRDLIDDDIVLIHGDLMFEKKLLERLLKEKHSNCVLVNKTIKAPRKDFKAVIENNRVVKIGVEFYGKNAYFSAPLYKFSKSDFILWLCEIEKAVNRGDLKIYAETIFNDISGKIFLYPLFYKDEFCMEIDTLEDLKIARRVLRDIAIL
jgi:phosphoenolpyruvate phosphomutase